MWQHGVEAGAKEGEDEGEEEEGEEEEEEEQQQQQVVMKKEEIGGGVEVIRCSTLCHASRFVRLALHELQL
jgi:hypothetical protein